MAVLPIDLGTENPATDMFFLFPSGISTREMPWREES